MVALPTGATVFTLCGAFGIPSSMPPMLGGEVTAGNFVVPIIYPNWGIGSTSQLEAGSALLDAQLTATSGPKIVMGHSLGSVVACYWLAHYGPTSSVSPGDLTFVLLANSNRPYGGLCYDISWFDSASIPVNTPYTVYDFARQYDGWADWPQNSGIAIAVENGLTGQGSIHTTYQMASLNDPLVLTYSVGNIHYMWDTTWPVPILGTLQTWDLILVDATIRPSIEAAYSRPCGALNTPNYI